MSKKVNQDQIRKIVELVDRQDYSFRDAGKALGLSAKTASKYYRQYKTPKVEEKLARELYTIKQESDLEDRKKAEEKRKLLESLDRMPKLPIEATKKPNSLWKLIGIIALIGGALIAALVYLKKPEKPALTQEQANQQVREALAKEKDKSKRKTVTFAEFRGN